MVRERNVESYLSRRVAQLGGISVKLAPTAKGVPDRLILLPEGRCLLVELKAPGRSPSPAQAEWHRRALELGTQVHVIDDAQQIDLLLAGMA